MTKWMLAAGAAALAITSPAFAQKGHGGGSDHGQGQGAKQDRGGGGNGGMKAERGNGGAGMRAMKVDRGNGGGQTRMERKAEHRSVQREDHGNNGHQQARFDRADRGHKTDNGRVMGNDRREARDMVRNAERVRDVRIANDDRGNRFVPRWDESGLVRGLADGCPPGLAKKNNGCLPPGQAKKLVGTLLPAYLADRSFDGAYRQWYRDNDDYYYRNDDDYIYRVRRDGGLIDAFFPSYDRDYSYYPVGMNYPSDYNFYNVPYQYSSYYPDGGGYNYRYGDGAIYQVNQSNGLIQGIAALLAGDLSVGQRLPSNYGVYNVPLDYRDRYYDTDQDMYRYNDGYIYRVDPTTQLITAVINAIV